MSWLSEMTERDRRFYKKLGMKGNRLNMQREYSPAFRNADGVLMDITVQETPECYNFYAQKARDIRYGYKKA